MKRQPQPIRTVAVVGAGAVGLFYGAKLQRAGLEVTFQTASGAAALAVRPLVVKSVWGDFRLKLRACASTAEMAPADLVIVSVKAHPDIEYGTLLAPVVRTGSVILLLQNGINLDERLAALFPQATVLAGLAFTCINRTGPASVRHEDYGRINIGALDRNGYSCGRRLAGVLEGVGIEAAFGGSSRLLRWKKLLWNVPFNCLSVVAGGVTTDRLIACPATLDLARTMMEEVCSIARAEGCRITRQDIETMIGNTRRMAPYRTSMMIDFELGRPMESEAILGEPLRTAAKLGVPAPAMETVYRLLTFYNGG